MIWLALFVAVVVAVVTAAAVLGRVDGSLADATTTMSHVPLPDDPLTPGDLDGLRFDTVTRGYRMSQVDGVIDRLRREIGDLQAQLDRSEDQADAGLRPESVDDGDGQDQPAVAPAGASPTEMH